MTIWVQDLELTSENVWMQGHMPVTAVLGKQRQVYCEGLPARLPRQTSKFQIHWETYSQNKVYGNWRRHLSLTFGLKCTHMQTYTHICIQKFTHTHGHTYTNTQHTSVGHLLWCDAQLCQINMISNSCSRNWGK